MDDVAKAQRIDRAADGSAARAVRAAGYRVAGYNAMLLIAAVVVTIWCWRPHKISSFATDEAIVLASRWR